MVMAVSDKKPWTVTGTSADNASQTLTFGPATLNMPLKVVGFEVVIRGAAAGADIQVQMFDGTTVLWETWIGNAAPRGDRVGLLSPIGFPISRGNQAKLTVGAGGSGVLTVASLLGYYAL